MIKLLRKIISFSILLLTIFSVLNAFYIYQVRKFFIVDEEITSVFVGDSHFQNGINDQLISQSINFANSGESLIYSRIKLEYLLENNSSIKNVFLSIHNATFQYIIDSSWISNEANYLTKFSALYPLFKIDHIYDWVHQVEDYSVAKILHNILRQTIYSIERQLLIGKIPYLGAYTPNNKRLNIKEYKSSNSTSNNISKTSEKQKREFIKIKDLCEKANVNLILINTPVYRDNGHENFIHDHGISNLFENATFWDYSELFDSNVFFADNSHLNPKGAEILSRCINDSITAWDKTKSANIVIDGF